MPPISFTSPAPMPPTLYRGNRQARPTIIPPRPSPRPDQPPTAVLYSSPEKTIEYVSQFGTRSCLPSMYAATISTRHTSRTFQFSSNASCQPIFRPFFSIERDHDPQRRHIVLTNQPAPATHNAVSCSQVVIEKSIQKGNIPVRLSSVETTNPRSRNKPPNRTKLR